MWEYQTKIYCDVDISKINIDKWLNQCGKDGWELVTILRIEYANTYYFKRRLE